MRDFASLSLPELQSLLRDCIGRRIDAVGDGDRACAGEDLLRLLDELQRRGCYPAGRAATRREPRTVPAPQDGRTRLGAMRLAPSSTARRAVAELS